MKCSSYIFFRLVALLLMLLGVMISTHTFRHLSQRNHSPKMFDTTFFIGRFCGNSMMKNSSLRRRCLLRNCRNAGVGHVARWTNPPLVSITHRLTSLGMRPIQQASDERDLSRDVPFSYSLHLSLEEDIHTCISLERVPSPLKRKEAHSSLDQLFDEAEILFNNNIEMLLLPQFTRFWNGSFGLQFVVGFGKCSTMLLLYEQHPCCCK